ncbi:hypothetical protein BLA18110_01389 [Burkholderia lata]|nr:hypothetical protein BLA18110_01389 [Burkholderia lata]
MKCVILDNTAWTTHFVVLQSISRAAETASIASRRTTERLVCWTHPTSSLPPFIPIRSSDRFRRHVARAVTNFFRSALTEIPVRRMRELHLHPCTHPSMQVTRCTRRCTIAIHACRLSHFSAAETTTPAYRGRCSSPNGDRCAASANQKVSQSSASAVAAVCAGAAEAAAGLRTGAVAAARFGAASRSSRAAAWTGTATAAEGARGA